MVGTGDKHCIIALEPMIADQDILQVHIKRVSDMEVAVGVWWWHDDTVRLTFTCGRKRIARLP